MNNKNSISVLGCGWLGFPLAMSLIKKGYTIKGSTTSVEKLPLLAKEGIEPFLVQFQINCIPETLLEFLKSDILIIAVPPGRNSLKHQSYFGMLNSLTEIIPEGSMQKIIFISSTSVYGNENKMVSERDVATPGSDAGKRMLMAEQIIEDIPVRHAILRLSGLIGPNRHPGKFMAGKTQVPNGLGPVNLIHLNDVIGIIHELLKNESEGVYVASAPEHPTKKEFYTLASQLIGLEAPQFIPEKIAWKEIVSERVTNELNYKFLVPDLIQWIKNNQ